MGARPTSEQDSWLSFSWGAPRLRRYACAGASRPRNAPRHNRPPIAGNTESPKEPGFRRAAAAARSRGGLLDELAGALRQLADLLQRRLRGEGDQQDLSARAPPH